MWCRLLFAGALVALAGCEQSSYSSSHRITVEPLGTPLTADSDAADIDEPAAAEVPASSAPAEPAPPAAAQPVKDITFDDIKFDIEKDGKFERSMLTPKIEELAGRTIRIRGYILPASMFQQTGARNFVLVRDNMECCFGPGAALYDCIVVEMTPPATANFSVRPVAVEGTFGIRELVDLEGVVRAVYRLDARSVQ
jgi:hypothetical protein